jgi:hypothetical protein
MEFDDLRVIEVSGGEPGHVDEQHRADGEVGRDDRAQPPLAREPVELFEERVVEPGGADDGPRARFDGRAGDHGRPRRHREVDHDIGPEVRQRRARLRPDGNPPAGRQRHLALGALRLDHADRLEVRGGVQRLERLAAHAAASAHHHANRHDGLEYTAAEPPAIRSLFTPKARGYHEASPREVAGRCCSEGR